jgi:hypothetical protein
MKVHGKARARVVEIAAEALRSVDIVEWLINNKSEIEPLKALADAIGGACDEILRKHSDEKTRAMLQNHFWCKLVVKLLQTLGQFENELEEALGDVFEAVWAQAQGSLSTADESTVHHNCESLSSDRASDTGPHGSELKDATSVFVKGVIAALGDEALKAASDAIKLKLQILALLLCPNPDLHDDVWNDCLRPLVSGEIAKTIKPLLESGYAYLSLPKS